MLKRLLCGFCVFFAADLFAVAYFGWVRRSVSSGTEIESLLLWGAVGPLIVAPITLGWRSESFREVTCLSVCAVGAYLTLPLLGSLLSQQDNSIGGASVLVFGVAVVALSALVLTAAGWIASVLFRSE